MLRMLLTSELIRQLQGFEMAPLVAEAGRNMPWHVNNWERTLRDAEVARGTRRTTSAKPTDGTAASTTTHSRCLPAGQYWFPTVPLVHAMSAGQVHLAILSLTHWSSYPTGAPAVGVHVGRGTCGMRMHVGRVAAWACNVGRAVPSAHHARWQLKMGLPEF